MLSSASVVALFWINSCSHVRELEVGDAAISGRLELLKWRPAG